MALPCTLGCCRREAERHAYMRRLGLTHTLLIVARPQLVRPRRPGHCVLRAQDAPRELEGRGERQGAVRHQARQGMGRMAA